MNLNDCIFRIIDTETTGLDPAVDRMCEVAWADMLADGEVLDRFQSLIDPLREIPAQASAVHHLTDDDVRGQPTWEVIAPRCAIDEARCFVAHNAEFDRGFTKLPGIWLCTHRLAKHLWPEAPGHGNEALRYWLKLHVDTVKDAASHRAVNDVMVTVAILRRALVEVRERWKDVQTIEQLVLRVAQPAKLLIVPFKSAKGVKFEDADTSLLRWIISKEAGGSDCVFSAQQELERRFGKSADDDDDDGLFGAGF